MAKQEEDGRYRSINGQAYDDEAAAKRGDIQALNPAGSSGPGSLASSFTSVASYLVPIGIAAGFMLMMFFIGLAFLRGYIILATRLPLFAVSGILDNSFALSRVMTPKGRADVLLTYIYTQGFENARYGYAMAITAFTLVLAIVLAALSRLITNRKER